MRSTTLNVVSIKMFESPDTYIFAYDDDPESRVQLLEVAYQLETDKQLDFGGHHTRALLQGIQNNQENQLGDSRGEIEEACEKLLDQLFTTDYGGLICLIDDCCPLYTIIEVLRSLLIDERILYRIESLTHVMVKLLSGEVKHAYFVRQSESKGLPLEDWPVFDMTGLGEIG